MYAALIPPWQAPEEPAHFEVVRLNYEHGRAISASDRSPILQQQILESMHNFYFWEYVPWVNTTSGGYAYHQPQLYYRLSSVMLALAPRGSLIEQLYLVRLASVVLGVLVVAIAYFTTMLLFPNDIFLRIGIPLFVSFLPTHTFSTSTVNNDSLAEVVATLIILITVVILKNGPSIFGLFYLVMSFVLGYFSKRTFLFSIPVAVVGVILAFWLHPPRSRLSRLIIVIGVIVTLSGGLWLRNISGLDQWLNRLITYFLYGNIAPFDFKEMLQVLTRVYPQYAQTLFESFWGSFGWGTVRLAPFWYGLLFLASLGATIGLIRVGLKQPRPFVSWQYATIGLYLLAICLSVTITIAVTLDLETPRTPEVFRGALPQARYILPAIVPIATLFTMGIRAWVPSRYARPALLAYTFALFGLDTLSVLGFIVPFYYGRII